MALPGRHRPSQTPNIPPRTATEADRRKYRIPLGFTVTDWDPSQEPILLLGSVFDANNLGKWIYDWTIFHHGPATTTAQTAYDLWNILNPLSAKMKRAEECLPKIRSKENQEMIEDFLDAGERVMERLKNILKRCEKPILKAALKSGKSRNVLSKEVDCEFVNMLFGEKYQRENTMAFITGAELWNLRFDANCEDILSRPEQ
jgi:hypothetical protein